MRRPAWALFRVLGFLRWLSGEGSELRMGHSSLLFLPDVPDGGVG